MCLVIFLMFAHLISEEEYGDIKLLIINELIFCG